MVLSCANEEGQHGERAQLSRASNSNGVFWSVGSADWYRACFRRGKGPVELALTAGNAKRQLPAVDPHTGRTNLSGSHFFSGHNITIRSGGGCM
jgi:hypothetical protein